MIIDIDLLARDLFIFISGCVVGAGLYAWAIKDKEKHGR